MNSSFSIRYLTIALALAIGLSASGCSSSRETFGLGKSAPNEFAVLTRAPLSMPPDYGLRTPTPGAPRPQEKTVQQEARRLLLQNTERVRDTTGPDKSNGEAALLSRAGATQPDPGIREKVARENKLLGGKDAGLIDVILFWRDVEHQANVVDPEKESRRLRENAALGDPPTKGRTPIIERKERGLLEGLFN